MVGVQHSDLLPHLRGAWDGAKRGLHRRRGLRPDEEEGKDRHDRHAEKAPDLFALRLCIVACGQF